MNQQETNKLFISDTLTNIFDQNLSNEELEFIRDEIDGMIDLGPVDMSSCLFEDTKEEELKRIERETVHNFS